MSSSNKFTLPNATYHLSSSRPAAPSLAQSYVFHNSCGSVYALLDDLIDAGVDVMNPTQVSAFQMETWRIKEKAVGKLCFHGGIDLQDVLSHYPPDEVKRNTEQVMSVLGRGGGYLCAPCHPLPEDVPVENILVMCSTRQTLTIRRVYSHSLERHSSH